MSLPKLRTGTRHELSLPSNGKTISYRPFLVKEEKIILQALNSETDDEMMQAVKNVAENCTFGEINVDKIPFVDLEWIFLNLRMRSKGEIVQAKYKCKNIIEESGEECGHINEVDINLDNVYVTKSDKGSNNIEIDSDGPIGMILKSPTKEFAERWKDVAQDTSLIFNMLADSIESIYDGENVFYPDDFDEKEINDFIDQMDNTSFQKVNDFFENQPSLHYDMKFKCSKCKHDKEITLKGLKSFLV